MSCPVCGATSPELFARAKDKEYFTSDEEYRYLRCRSCTAVYLDSPPADRLDEIYPPNYYSYGDVKETTAVTERVKEWLDRHALRKLLSRLPGSELRVLDVGGGSGWTLTSARAVCSRVVETHEVDMAPSAEELAVAAGHVYHCMPIEQFETDVRFDLVLMNSLIEHVPDPGLVLRRVAGLLTPHGVLVVKTPNTETLDCRIFRHLNWGGYHCPRHFVLFNEPSVKALADRCGLRLVGSSYTQGAPQWAISVMATMYDRGWLELSRDKPAYQHKVYEPLTALFAAFDFMRAPFVPTAQMILEFERA
jgi:SAM-dependent methyltransferase